MSIPTFRDAATSLDLAIRQLQAAVDHHDNMLLGTHPILTSLRSALTDIRYRAMAFDAATGASDATDVSDRTGGSDAAPVRDV